MWPAVDPVDANEVLHSLRLAGQEEDVDITWKLQALQELQARLAFVAESLDRAPPPAAETGAPLLLVLDAKRGYRWFGLGSTTVLGSDPQCNCVVNLPGVSGNHARIWKTDAESWAVLDLASANGTYLNGKRLGQGSALHDGDILTFGPVHAIFLAQAP